MNIGKPHLLRLLGCPVIVLGCHAGFQVLHSLSIQLLYLACQLGNVLVAQLLSPSQHSTVELSAS